MSNWHFSHSFTLCHAQCILLSDMLFQQLYFFFEKEILELLTKSLHKYRVITLLRTLGDSIFCLHVLFEWHSQWDLFKSASSAPGIEDVKNHSENVESLKMIIINYLHQVPHSLNTFLKKNLFQSASQLAFIKSSISELKENFELIKSNTSTLKYSSTKCISHYLY